MEENKVQVRESNAYESPEVVKMGSVTQLTQGMGGDSHDTGGMTIPVTPRPTAS